MTPFFYPSLHILVEFCSGGRFNTSKGIRHDVSSFQRTKRHFEIILEIETTLGARFGSFARKSEKVPFHVCWLLSNRRFLIDQKYFIENRSSILLKLSCLFFTVPEPTKSTKQFYCHAPTITKQIHSKGPYRVPRN